MDFHKAELEANAATENIFAHIDGEGNQFMHLDTISNHRVNGEELKHQDAFITFNHGSKWRRDTTKGWEILLQWKDGSYSWETLKDIKNS